MKIDANILWTALSAVATLCMAFVTLWSLLTMKQQHREMTSARLLFSIVRRDDTIFLKIKNVGHSIARDIRLHFDDNFEKIVGELEYERYYEQLKTKGIAIDAQDARFYFIRMIPDVSTPAPMGYGFVENPLHIQYEEWIKKNKDIHFTITGVYNGDVHVNEQLSISAFLNGGFLEKEEIATSIDRLNDTIQSVNKTINEVAQNIANQRR